MDVWVTENSAINIECHVGYYDVLIDCLTTTVSRGSRRQAMIENRKDIWASSRHFFWLFFWCHFNFRLMCDAAQTSKSMMYDDFNWLRYNDEWFFNADAGKRVFRMGKLGKLVLQIWFLVPSKMLNNKHRRQQPLNEEARRGHLILGQSWNSFQCWKLKSNEP